MKKKHLQTAVSLAAAAAMAFSTGISSLAAALPKHQNPTDLVQKYSDEPVPVIISLDADPIMEEVTDAAYLETHDAAAESDALKRGQDAVIARIRKLYPDLEVGYRYTTLMNGFSCSIPENLIEQVKALPGVSDVARTGNLHAKEEMYAALDYTDFPSYYDETGCTGEGQVIAVIDSEIDVTHPMFAPLADDVETKLDKSDLEAINNGIGFNLHARFETDKVYQSNKIPFAVDYSDQPDQLSNTDLYHGTHVCGIAAGNRFTDENGREIHGVAPDAQIVFMGMDAVIFENQLEELLIAAIEDATKLNVDVINMSLGIDGDPMGYTFLEDVINRAERAGITVCISAGNSDNGEMQYSETHYTDHPDVSWLNGFIDENTHALAVASANNPSDAEYRSLMHNGRKIAYEGSKDQNTGIIRYLGEELEQREYEYEYCGLGYPEDFAGKDLSGKLALVDRGELLFSEKADHAKDAGAVGVIVIQNTDADLGIMSSYSDLALVMISKANGAILRDAEVKTVSFTDDRILVTRATGVSDYTSWGIHSSMELRPDIMGIGGNVESAAYNSSTSVMSGTSMSSPYLCGCTAVLKQYLLENGCTLKGSAMAKYIRNLLMTGAAPLSEDNMFVTPRRQGAGLVNLNASIHSKVLLTGLEGESKISLRDKLGTSFTFPLIMTNISNEDVSFSSVSIALTTDGSSYDSETGKYLISGQQPLNCTASFRDARRIAAGETKTVNITVTLDAAQTAELKSVFTNGFFIEGYLMLGGAKNSADISIPLVGFSDNFALIPAFGEDAFTCVLMNYYSGMDTRIPLCKLMKAYTDILDRIAENDPSQLEANKDDSGWILNTFYDNMDTNDIQSLYNDDNTVYCSPNDDGLAELFGLYPDATRACYVGYADVLNTDGNTVMECFDWLFYEKNIPDWRGKECIGPDQTLDDLEEGRYTGQVHAMLRTAAANEDRQSYDFPLCIDKTAPTLTGETEEVDGRKILKLTAFDNAALDGLVILGNGTGNIVGSSRPMQNTTGMMLCDFMKNMPVYLNSTFDKHAYSNGIMLGYEDYLAMHPLALTLLGESTNESNEYFDMFSYMDFIPAEPDEDGTFKVSYDITDLSVCNVIAVDRAFNMDSLTIGTPEQPDSITPGVYQSGNGLYIFTEDTLHFIAAMKNHETTYHYTVSEGKITLTGDLADSIEQGESTFKVSCGKNGELKFSGEFDHLLGYNDPEKDDHDIAKLVKIENPESYYAIRGFDAEDRYLKPYVREMMGTDVHIGQTDYRFLNDGVVIFDINCFTNDMFYKTVSFQFDLKTGIATLNDGTKIDFLHLNGSIRRGDVDCSGSVDVSDAVLLARFLAEDDAAFITDQGMANADCNDDNQRSSDDVVLILRAIARLITLE